MDEPREIERKYLIEMPEPGMLTAQAGCRVAQIEQTYLEPESPGTSERVRSWRENEGEHYFHTVKRPISALERIEIEREIAPEAYRALLARAQVGLNTIRKVRYVIPHGALFVEVDVYPFWHKQAVAEIEMPSPDTVVALPDYLQLIREVTEDKRYTNHALAARVPPE